MKRIPCRQQFLMPLLAAVLIFSAAITTAADFTIDTTAPNGLTGIYSATFDPPLDQPGDPFFGGNPPATRNITIDPNPTAVAAMADTALCKQAFSAFDPGAPPIVPPCTTLYPTATPSTLDLTLSAGNTQLAINGGNIFFPNLTIIIFAGQTDQTDVLAAGASIVNFAPSVGTVPVDGNGVAVFEIDINPMTAADFSTFTEIVTGCSGTQCALIPLLTLDMIRYRLTIDWDPTFSFFTADFIGQTVNNSMVFATLNSGVPNITVTNSAIFGDVIKNETAVQTVTVTNDGLTDLVIAQIGQTNSLSPPFSIPAAPDNCSLQRVAPGANCTFDVQFAPTATGAFSDSFDIPSNDPTMATATVSVSGTGVAPVILVTNSVIFGSVTEMTNADQVVTVTNGGDTDLVIGTIVQPNTPFSIPGDTCSGQTLNIAASCTMTVRFSPASVGAFSDNFDIPSNDPDTPIKSVSVSGTGTAVPVAKISVIDLVNFGSVIEMTTASQSVTVTSSGTANLVIGQISQPGSALFSMFNDTCSNQTLPPSANCTLTAQFAPTGIGSALDSFDIPSNDLDKPTATVSLIGTGAPTPVPDIMVTDSVPPVDDLTIPFGDVIEMMTADETITVTNNGTADLVIGQIVQLNAPFSVFNDLCSNQTLVAAADCTIEVRFAPPATGTFNGSVDIPSNDPNNAIVTVVVTGAGILTAADISVTDPIPPQDDLMMPYGNVTEATAWDLTVTITNDGNLNLVIGMIAQTDTLADPFSILSDTCSGQIIAPAASATPPPSCTIDVRFLPSTVGVFNDSFDIPSNDPDEPVLTFSIDGNGVVVGTGVIDLKPSGANSGFFGMAISPAILLALFLSIAVRRRRRFR